MKTAGTAGRTHPALIVGLVLFSLVGACGFLASVLPKPPPDREEEQRHAWTMAKQFVTRNIKTPATAQFCKLDASDGYCWRRNDEQWEATGWVDAQNLFGALVRHRWRVVFTEPHGSESQWVLQYLQIGDEQRGNYPADRGTR